MTSEYQVEVDKVTPSEWDELLGGFDDASVYQTWAYGAVHWGEKQLSHFVLKRSGVVMAAAQVRLVTVPVLGSGVAYVRWGPLWQRAGQPVDSTIFLQALRAIQSEYGERRRLLLRISPPIFACDPATESIKAMFREQGFSPSDSMPMYRTLCVDLKPSLELIRKSLDQKWRNQLNRAEKNGLTILEGDSDECYGIFLKLYDEMYARKQFETTVDPREFAKIQAALPPGRKMQIMICEEGNHPIGALVSSAWGGTGIYLLGASNEQGMKQKSSYLLQWRMIQWLKEQGCSYYDLGGINPERNPGVYHFKSGLSGRDTSLIGAYEFSGSWKSAVAVRIGEKLRRWLSVSNRRAVDGKSESASVSIMNPNWNSDSRYRSNGTHPACAADLESSAAERVAD